MSGTEIVGSAVAAEVYKDGRRIVNNINQTVNYARDLKKHYKRLTDIAEKLSARKEDIVAEANKYKTKQFTRECQVWMSTVTKSEEDVQKLKTKYEKVRGKKRLWRVFNHRFRAKLSKSMAEKCNELHNLWSEAKFERGMMVEKPPERVRIMHAPKIEDKPSLHCVVEDILSLLRDGNVKKIGLWGMVGIGKTTIMQNLNDNEDIAKMFDIVIWVHVSQDWSVEKLQHVIVDRLKLNIEGITSVDEIAWRISMELECKRYLLLLDEVWHILDLKKIGIYGNQKDSKVVLATRYRQICHEMDALINVKRMSKDDAWKMFKEKVGQNINISGVEPIAMQVVRECAGLPLLIDRVASTFRIKDNVHLWRDGLIRLRRWRSIKVQGMDEFIECLKFCYEDLDADNKKFCFLYTALYPEDYDIYIDYLLECWKAEGFIHDADDFKVARGKGHTILDELIKVSLLERSKKMNHVSMNKVLRNMALKISSQSEDFKILVKTQEELQEPPNEEEWQQVNRISLMDSKLCILPELPDCNNLKTLLLQKNNDLKVIPHGFFRYMQNLLVLDLHGTGIASLPSSVSCLTCLRALYLNSCINLMGLKYLEELKHLEVLDIRRTGINHLPIEIGYLIQLKCLRMSLSNFGLGKSGDVEFHQNVFSNLSLLEELRIDVDPNNRRWEGVVKSITEEVATLKCLTSLSIFFPDVDCLRSFISTSPLWKEMHFTFHFSVGYHDSSSYHILDCFEYQFRKCFKLANGEGVNPAISEVLANSETFELIGHKGASRLSDFGIGNINKMRGCLIEGCDDIETIVDGDSERRSALENLEKMYINNVPKLESIWEGPVHSGSLANLTSLILKKCPKLKKIFSNGMIKELCRLQHLIIEGSLEIKEIITKFENNEFEPKVLPKLKTLELYDLPKVESICTDDSLEWPALENIKISMCQSLTRLPFNCENAVKLRCIECQQLWWSALVWNEDTIEQRLRSICIFN
ncbi:probable disease resistance protein At4g27220 [Quercus suber]|uniref:Disease resistance protein n=1 Tax=Quercus suber TaxID=58331 RepID=A0AAW0IZZ6_QUESU